MAKPVQGQTLRNSCKTKLDPYVYIYIYIYIYMEFVQQEGRVLTHSDHPTSVCDGSRAGDSSNGIRNT
jgi:hypothetical protein